MYSDYVYIHTCKTGILQRNHYVQTCHETAIKFMHRALYEDSVVWWLSKYSAFEISDHHLRVLLLSKSH